MKQTNSSKTKLLKKVGKYALIALLAVIVLVGGYATYFVASFTRIEDNLALVPTKSENNYEVSVLTQYNLLNWNVGFGAYSDDFSFFMDGGKYSRGFSEEAVRKNMQGIQDTVTEASKNYKNAFDFICYQEVDFDSTRSYHIDQREILASSHKGYSSVYAQNYNSPYIMFPLFSPHGANSSGLYTFSVYKIKSALRVQLPIENGFTKFFDLDRCYSKSRIPVVNGKDLVLINLHLSAYTSDGTISTAQLKMLLEDCKAEYQKGNYVICAGDFNKDLTDEGSAHYFGALSEAENWAKQIDPAIFEDSNMRKVAPLNKENPIPTCRNANRPYGENNSVYIVDGFLVSENVTVVNASTIDTGFKYSDHNPVVLSFELNKN